MPFTAKQPPVRLSPLLAVDDAADDVRLRVVACRPAEKVEVAVPCIVRNPVVVAPPEIVSPVACPPAPTVEEASARNPLVNVERPETANVPVAVMFEAVRVPLKKPLPATERRANGEVVPMPTLPAELMLKKLVLLDEAIRKRSAVCPARPCRSSVTTACPLDDLFWM